MSETINVMIVDDEPIIRKAVKYELNERHAQVECRLNDDGEVQTKEVQVIDTFPGEPQLFAALNDPQRPRPDYLLVDMEFQGEPTGGIAITRRMRKLPVDPTRPPVKIIILSGRFDNPLPGENDRMQRLKEIGSVVFEALHSGANAFVSKNAIGGFSIDNILHAIASLERGEQYYFNYPVLCTIKEAAELYFQKECDTDPSLAISDEERQILLFEADGCTAQEIASRLTPWVESDKSIQEKQKELSRRFNIVNKSGARIAKALQHHLIDPHDITYLKR